MNIQQLQLRAARRVRNRILAAAVLATLGVSSLGFALAGTTPLRPLRVVSRWSLERAGARFVDDQRVRLQSSLNDCGPTALADLLDLAGQRVPAADSLRQLSRLTARGTTLANLEQAAKVSGLETTAVHWSPDELETLPLPALVWVDQRHFVVVSQRVSQDSVEIHDPAAGLYRIARDRFAHTWTGEALIISDSLDSHRTSQSRLNVRPLGAQGLRALTIHSLES